MVSMPLASLFLFLSEAEASCARLEPDLKLDQSLIPLQGGLVLISGIIHCRPVLDVSLPSLQGLKSQHAIQYQKEGFGLPIFD